MAFIKVERMQLPDFKKSTTNKIHANAFKTVGLVWHRELRLKRFTVRGGRELGFAERSKKYMRLKMKKLRHSRPLEFTGRSKAASGSKRLQTTRNSVRIIHPLVRAFNFKPKNSKVDMRKEFGTVSSPEIRKLEGVHAKRVEEQYQKQLTYQAN